MKLCVLDKHAETLEKSRDIEPTKNERQETTTPINCEIMLKTPIILPFLTLIFHEKNHYL